MAPTKPKGEKRMNKVETFFSTDEMAENLVLAKSYLQKSKGEIMREALEDYLKKNFPNNIRKKFKDLIKNKK